MYSDQVDVLLLLWTVSLEVFCCHDGLVGLSLELYVVRCCEGDG